LVNAYDTLGQSSFVGLCSGNSINRLIELGINYHNAENFEASLSCLKLALQRVGNGNGISSIDLGRVYFYIGKNYTELTNYSQAQVELSRAFRLFSQSTSRNSIRWQANTLFALSTVASNLGDYSRTVEYLQKALQIYRALGSTYRRSQSATLNNLGLAYMNLGSYEEALQSFQASLQLTLPDETASKATTYGNIARTLTFLGRYREALDIALQVLEFRGSASQSNERKMMMEGSVFEVASDDT
jgi:tetratricopeptide (TPR) repeat protein